MTYSFKNAPIIPRDIGDSLIATALNGEVYIENSRIHVKGNNVHYIYKPDGMPCAGWYARNLKTCDDVFLGTGASPTIVLENIEIKNNELWEMIHYIPGTIN